MHLESGRRVVFIVAAFLLVGLCFTEGNSQTLRKKKSRRVTHPILTTAPTPTPTPTTSASSSDPRIISTADETTSASSATSAGRRSRSRRSTLSDTDDVPTREKVDKLTAQVIALNDKLSLMEQQQRTLVDLERLSRAETRGEGLRVQLRDVQTKEAELQARALQIEYEIQPDVIERTLASSGSTRPEELREQRRRTLEAEKTSVQTRLNQLVVSRSRLETAIANADAEADRLRTRVDEALTPSSTDPTSTDVGVAPAMPTQSPDTGEGEPEL